MCSVSEKKTNSWCIERERSIKRSNKWHTLVHLAYQCPQKERKSQGIKERGGRSSPIPEQKTKKDLSHTRCFKCEKYGHYARCCPSLKKRNQHASTTSVDEPPLKKTK